MPLAPGTFLGPFEIAAPLGAGGMGEVYRARDTRLDRTVAIKVLPEHLHTTAPARERFEREAKAISSLNHPHICTLYDVGHQNGIDYLVMEYLEGQTLADRINKGPLPLEQALQYSIEVAAALDTAHKHGVIHRDLKPGNIVLTKTGAKLLDFGLAKLRAVEAVAGTAVLTQTNPLTGEGTIMGTPQYMAPEQLEGADADARTDLFALGAVVYEMATGRKAFEGKTQAGLISAIMTAEPPLISTLQTVAPKALDHVVRTCLAKDPEERWQTAHDVLVELKWISETGSQPDVPGPIVTRRKNREVLGWALAVAASLAAVFLALIHFREKPVEALPVRFLVQTPRYLHSVEANIPAVAPNGQRFVFPATNADGKNQLWIRSLDSPAVQPIAGTEDGVDAFWSPDSRFIAFFSRGKLQKIDPSGGPPQILCDTQGYSRGGSWSRDGLILFGTLNNTLVSVSAQGGEVKPVHELDKSRHEVALGWPQFLPDGKHFLYDSFRPAGGSGIYLGSLDSKETSLLLPNESNIHYASPGFLIYSRQDTLFAQPFDANKLRLTGEPVSVAVQVAAMRFAPGSIYSVSQNGVLVYRGVGSADVQLAWYNRDGKRLSPVGQPGAYGIVTLSPDEKRVALERFDPQLHTNDLWTLDLASGIFTRLTFNPADETDPVWSPDGRELAFSSNRKGAISLYRKAIGGSDEELLFESAEEKYPKLWMKDGRSILFINEHGKTLYQLPLAGDRKPVTLTRSEFDRDNPRISPDGNWVAYNSLESGRWEVYVAAFPSFNEKRQVSGSGGCQPVWRKDGKEVFYRTLEGKLMVVDVKAGATLQTGAPLLLFQSPPNVNPVQSEYAVADDGKKFLFREPVGEGTAPVTVVLNWSAGLKR